jgi:hypothetical protein
MNRDILNDPVIQLTAKEIQSILLKHYFAKSEFSFTSYWLSMTFKRDFLQLDKMLHVLSRHVTPGLKSPSYSGVYPPEDSLNRALLVVLPIIKFSFYELIKRGTRLRLINYQIDHRLSLVSFKAIFTFLISMPFV